MTIPANRAKVQALRYQNGTSILRSQSSSSNGRGGRRYLPYVFTEQGVAMLSSVLRSRPAVDAIRKLMVPRVKPSPHIGFRPRA